MIKGTFMLTPIFENMPAELKSLNRWVVWKDGKAPHNPKAPYRKASVNNPNHWGSFEQAKLTFEKGGWFGVGFILDGTGIAGVDLDKCVVDVIPSPESLAILKNLGAAYIELSPSGTGLHAFGFAENLRKGVRRFFNNVDVELYSSGRHFTVTGHTIVGGPLKTFMDFAELAAMVAGGITRETHVIALSQSDSVSANAPGLREFVKVPTEETEDTECNLPSVSSVSSVEGMVFPEKAVPKAVGRRHDAIFHLARYLMGMFPNCTEDQRYALICRWHKQYLDVIGTKDLGTTWLDFKNAWVRVTTPFGSVIRDRLSSLPEAPPIAGLQRYGKKAVHLIRICMALQRHSGEPHFFLSCREAAKHLDCHYTEASAILRRFADEGWVTVEVKSTPSKAARYTLSTEICKHLSETLTAGNVQLCGASQV